MEALEKAKNTAVSILSQAALDFIKDIYGDADKFLTAKIEERVRAQKAEQGALPPLTVNCVN